MFKKSLSILLSLVLLFGALSVLPVAAQAEEADIAEVSSDIEIAEIGADDELAETGFSIRTSYPGLDNYYYVPRSNANPFDVNTHGGNCTWYAWGRVYEASGQRPNCLPTNVDAKDWYSYATCDKGSTPRAGAVICGNYDYGHVAFVEKVYDDGIHFDYTESNWGTQYPKFAYKSYKTTADFLCFQGFLYPFNGNPDPPKNAWISASSISIPVGGSITFTFGADGATNYWIGIDRNGNRIITEKVWSEKSYTFSEDGDYSAYVSADNSAGYVDSNRVYFTVNPKGYTMSESEGAGRTIPDGDYWICSKIAQDFFIDLPGDNIVATDGANVSTWKWNDVPGKYDVFHLEYLNNGFYRISQMNSNMSMDIEYSSLYRDANIHMWTKHDGVSQQWSIESSDKGYKIRSRCNSYYMDIDKGTHAGGTNVHVWESHNGDWQFFSFIPYNPTEQPLADGIYTIDSSVGDKCNLDVSSVPGDYVENSNVQIWNNSFEQFQIEYVGNGYYRLYEATSKLAVEIINDDTSYLNNNKNVRLNKKNNSREQYWKIKKNTDGTYCFINKLSGYCLDVYEGISSNGTNVHAHPYNGTNAQRWKPRRIIMTDMVTVGNVSMTSYTAELNPTVSVKVDNRILTKDTDYSVEVTADTEKNIGTITVTGKGDYSGSTSKDFLINIIVPTEPVQQLFLGDVDGDGEATVIDATYIQRYDTKMAIPVEEAVMLSCGDIDGDGDVTIVDATFIQRYATHIKVPYFIGEPIA